MVYVLGPYIATVVIGDPVRGQALVSNFHAIAGAIVALTAPFIGAAADRMGARKPLLIAVTAIMAPAIFAQYFAVPGGAGLPIWGIGLTIVVAGVMFVWSEVLHNAMLTSATPAALVPRTSGIGLSLGHGASVLLLVFALIAFALPGHVDVAFVPDAPLFGLNPATYEPTRIVAPLVAGWLVIFSLPLFLYTRDFTATGENWVSAVRKSAGNVWRTLRKLRDHRNVALFLLARMIFADGKGAILVIGGVYVAGVMGWELIDMLAYGVLLSTFAIVGGLVSGVLDERLGAKRALMCELALTLVCLVVMLSMSREAMFFVIPVDPAIPAWGGPVFQTAPELAYVAASMLIAISITAAFASSRTLMTQLSPPGMEGELFGLYALSGSATAWLGPLMVGAFTAAFANQTAGFASISILLVAGLAALSFVKAPERA